MQAATGMPRRPLGATNISVSEIGFGAWGIGGATPGATSYGTTDDATSLAALGRALERGINFIDTSAVYGYGHSELLIGEAIRDRRDEAVLATKAGLWKYGEPADFSPATLRRSLEGSLERLGTDHVDLFQLHNPAREIIEAPDDILACIAAFKHEGLIRAFGVSVRTPEDGLQTLHRLAPDAIQTNLNMMDQRALDCGLVAAARKSRVSIIARTPLNFGFLTGALAANHVFADNDHRSRWPREQIAAWTNGAAALLACRENGIDQTPVQFALRYCLSIPGVTAVIPGMLNRAEVDANVRAAELGALGDEDMNRIRQIYEANDRFRPAGGPAARTVDPGKIDSNALPHAAVRGTT